LSIHYIFYLEKKNGELNANLKLYLLFYQNKGDNLLLCQNRGKFGVFKGIYFKIITLNRVKRGNILD